MLASGCAKPAPEGQVIAKVNGVEITISELNEEAKARGLTIANDQALRDALVRDLIDRKLLVAHAVERRLDKTPEHLLSSRRMTEVLLAQELLAATAAEAKAPEPRELQRFVEAHPRAFGERVAMSLDVIAFAPTPNPKLGRAVAEAKSLDNVQALLSQAGLAGRRGIEIWDSANVDPKLTERILKSGDGVIVVPGPDRMVAARLLSAQPQPVPEAERLTVARELIRRQRTEALLQQLVQQARSEAKIEYQPEFAPTETGATRQ